MQSNDDDEKLIRRYLLGDASEEARKKIEERLLVDDPFYARLLVGEDELIDDYIDGALDGADRERAASVFLAAPERREQLRFARLLRRAATGDGSAGARRTATARPTGVSPWLVAALVLVTVGLGVLAVTTYRLSQSLDVERRERAEERRRADELAGRVEAGEAERGQLSSDLARERRERERLEAEAAVPPAAPRAGPSVVALLLRPGLVRDGGELARARLTADTASVRLSLEPGETRYAAYRAAVVDEGGATVWSAGAVRPQQSGRVVLSVPARKLAPGDYRVSLDGLTPEGAAEPAAKYTFRVVGGR